jgi:hypothetical protein
MVDTGLLSLADAHARYERGGGRTPLSSWRVRVREGRRVYVGEGRQFAEGASTTVQADKVGGRWFVDEQDLVSALNETALARTELDWISALYEQHQLLGEPGQQVKTTWGYYTVSSPFHEHFDPIAEYHRGNGSQYVCNACWTYASYEHNGSECHLCRDWGGCGRDCTRSATICLKCTSPTGLGPNGTRRQL